MKDDGLILLTSWQRLRLETVRKVLRSSTHVTPVRPGTQPPQVAERVVQLLALRCAPFDRLDAHSPRSRTADRTVESSPLSVGPSRGLPRQCRARSLAERRKSLYIQSGEPVIEFEFQKPHSKNIDWKKNCMYGTLCGTLPCSRNIGQSFPNMP